MSIEFEGKKSVITPEGVFIIGTYDENGVPNAMNAAWGMQSDMGKITLMLSKHKTTENFEKTGDRKSTRLNSSHPTTSRMPSSA